MRRANEQLRRPPTDAPEGSDKGTMPRATAMLILRCLHPDSRNALSDELMAKAFVAFKEIADRLTMSEQAERRKASAAEQQAQQAEWRRRREEERRRNRKRAKAAWAKRRAAAPHL